MSYHKGFDIYIDGSSLGNPGDAGIGIIIALDGHPLKNISQYIGTQTNNIAEYTALIAALKEALDLETGSVRVFSDSELLCRQINGAYKVKNAALKDLFTEAQGLIARFEDFSIRHIPREENRGADKLAQAAARHHKSKVDGIAARSHCAREESPSSKGQRNG